MFLNPILVGGGKRALPDQVHSRLQLLDERRFRNDLLAAVRIVAGGEALLAPSVTRRLMEEFAGRPAAPVMQPPRGFDMLTPRETEVLTAVARGLSNAEIAATLFMSHATAKTHVSRLLTKLHARDRAQLVMIAYQAGVVALSCRSGRRCSSGRYWA